MILMAFNLVGVTEAAQIIGVTPSRVRQLLRAGELKGEKLGPRAWAITRKEVERAKADVPTLGRPRSGSI